MIFKKENAKCNTIWNNAYKVNVYKQYDVQTTKPPIDICYVKQFSNN